MAFISGIVKGPDAAATQRALRQLEFGIAAIRAQLEALATEVDGLGVPSGAVSSVTAGSSAVTVSPTTGAVVVDVNEANFSGIPESAVTSLVADLAGKASAIHTHPESDITSLVAHLAGKAPLSHTHPESDITSLIADLATKVPTTRSLLATSPIRIDGGGSADLSANRTISFDSSALVVGFFGDGSDGDLNFDGVATVLTIAPSGPATIAVGVQTTAGSGSVSGSLMFYNLTRDVYANNMTVASGVLIQANGFRIFVKGTLTLNGYIGSVGSSGGNASGASGGTAGSGRSAGTLGGSAAGGAGGNTSTGVAVNGGAITNGIDTYVAGAVAASGQNGGSGQGGSGGASGASGGALGGSMSLASITTFGHLHNVWQAVTGRGLNNTQFQGGSGGGGGRGDTVAPTGGGGGGGGGGGPLVVFARAFAGSGWLIAHGGHGGNGFEVGGGGGGGGGGWIVVGWATGAQPNTDVYGGTGGGGGGSGGGAGGRGGDGYVYLYNMGIS